MNSIMRWRTVLPIWICALALTGALAAAGAPAGTSEPSGQDVSRDSAADAPEAALIPFLGTWQFDEVIDHGNGKEPFPIRRFLLIRWHRGKLQVKTFDYFPDYKARDMESTWKGNIIVDQWNQTKQTFNLRPDGTITVGLSGTDGIGPQASKNMWWAAGRMEVLADGENGPHLRYYTSKGYAPSKTGNAWRPFDRAYELVSRDIDPDHARPAGH
jgi:hypothetical protein